MSDMQIVVFSLNNELCGVNTSQVFKIIKYQEITKVPDMPDFIEGITNLRGRVVPVVNLNKRFDLGVSEISKKTKIIITEIEKSLIGFIVNDVTEILRLSAEDVELAPDIIHKAGNSYLRNVGKKDDKLISIMDFTSILNDSEMKHIEDKNFEEKKEN